MTYLRTTLGARSHRLEILVACMALLAALVPLADLVAAPPASGVSVPMRKITFEVSGAQGDINGGRGAVIQATTSLASGSTVTVKVGGTKGYNGGGAAGKGSHGAPGTGGGASDVRIGGTSLTNRVLVAAGGGGRGGESYKGDGGAGGVGSPGNGQNGYIGRRWLLRIRRRGRPDAWRRCPWPHPLDRQPSLLG